MIRARKYVVVKKFDGLPKASDYELVSYDLPPLHDGGILVKAEWLSVDPHFRAIQSIKGQQVPYDQFGFQVGLVIESRNAKYPVGTRVVSHKGWTDYYVHYDGDQDENFVSTPLSKLPDMPGLPTSYGVGAVGMPGASAYFGLLEICEPKPGETVVVIGAAGAVGSLVGQIAKIKGCRVIGFAGSDEKVKWLENDLGFDKAYNYKKIDTASALSEAAPNGVDCIFDNVGGNMFSDVVAKINECGRIAVCGSISNYNQNEGDRAKVTDLHPIILRYSLKVAGVRVWSWLDRWPEAFGEIVQWISAGRLKVREHVTEGFENVIEAFVGMLKGENFGKAVVKV